MEIIFKFIFKLRNLKSQLDDYKSQNHRLKEELNQVKLKHKFKFSLLYKNIIILFLK